MEQKKRRFFSAFDVCLVLLIVLGAGVWLWLSSPAAEGEDMLFQGRPAIVRLEVAELTQEQVELAQIGDRLYDAARHDLFLGKIVDIEVHGFEVRVENWDSRVITIQEVPDRYTLILSIETEVEETEQSITTVDGIRLRGGRSINFIGPGYGYHGAIILRIEREA